MSTYDILFWVAVPLLFILYILWSVWKKKKLQEMKGERECWNGKVLAAILEDAHKNPNGNYYITYRLPIDGYSANIYTKIDHLEDKSLNGKEVYYSILNIKNPKMRIPIVIEFFTTDQFIQDELNNWKSDIRAYFGYFAFDEVIWQLPIYPHYNRHELIKINIYLLKNEYDLLNDYNILETHSFKNKASIRTVPYMHVTVELPDRPDQLLNLTYPDIKAFKISYIYFYSVMGFCYKSLLRNYAFRYKDPREFYQW